MVTDLGREIARYTELQRLAMNAHIHGREGQIRCQDSGASAGLTVRWTRTMPSAAAVKLR